MYICMYFGAYLEVQILPAAFLYLISINLGGKIMAEKNYLGNGLTYGKFILIMIATRTISMAAAHGIYLPMSDVELAGYLGLLAGFIYSILDSYFKNNLKWNRFKKFVTTIINKEIPEEKTEVEDDVDPTTETEIEPEELEDDVVGEDVDEPAEC